MAGRKPVTASESKAESEVAFPLKVGANRRYLVDRTGRPVFFLGTTQWELFHGYTLEQARTIIRASRRNGFQFIQVKLLGGGEGNIPSVYGELGYHDGDVLKPNEAYFRNVDAVLQAALEENTAILMSVYHQRYRAAITLDKSRFWARWLASRYRDQPHIVWTTTPEATDEFVPVVRQIAAGLREGDGGRHLISCKPDPAPFSSSFVHADPWLDFNAIQTWKDVKLIHPMVSHDYGLVPTKPVLMAEGAYEAGTEYGFDVTPLWVRRQAYYSFLAGAHHAYGHNDAWRVLPSWEKSLDAPGARQMGILRKTFQARTEWWLLVPDQGVLASGGRTDGEILTLGARHERGEWVMVYLAEPGEVSVDTGKLRGSEARAAWIDPRTGEEVSLGRIPTRGSRGFSAPAGWEDALLVLEA